jgi:hypothetical protein
MVAVAVTAISANPKRCDVAQLVASASHIGASLGHLRHKSRAASQHPIANTRVKSFCLYFLCAFVSRTRHCGVTR